jgi:hypothetical protein
MILLFLGRIISQVSQNLDFCGDPELTAQSPATECHSSCVANLGLEAEVEFVAEPDSR